MKLTLLFIFMAFTSAAGFADEFEDISGKMFECGPPNMEEDSPPVSVFQGICIEGNLKRVNQLWELLNENPIYTFSKVHAASEIERAREECWAIHRDRKILGVFKKSESDGIRLYEAALCFYRAQVSMISYISEEAALDCQPESGC